MSYFEIFKYFFQIRREPADKLYAMRVFPLFLILFPLFGYGSNGPDAFSQHGEDGAHQATHGSRTFAGQAYKGDSRTGRREFQRLQPLFECHDYGGTEEMMEGAGCRILRVNEEACPGLKGRVFGLYDRLGHLEQKLNRGGDHMLKMRIGGDLKSLHRAIYQSLCRCRQNIETKYANLRQEINMTDLEEAYKQKEISKVISTHERDQSKAHIVSLAKLAEIKFKLLKEEHDKCFGIAGSHVDWLRDSSSPCRGSGSDFDLFKRTAELSGDCAYLSAAHESYLKALDEYKAAAAELNQCDEQSLTCAKDLERYLGSRDYLGLFEICGEGFSTGLRCCGSLDCSGSQELSAQLDSFISSRGASFQKACRGDSAAYQDVLDSALHAQQKLCQMAKQTCSNECENALEKFQEHFKECFAPGKSIRDFLQKAKAASNKTACQIRALEVSNLYREKLQEFHKNQAAAAANLPGLRREDSQRFQDFQ